MTEQRCVVVGDRVTPLAGEGPWPVVCDGRRVRVARRGEGLEVEDLEGANIALRGQRRARHRVEAGDALAVGRAQLLVGSVVEGRTVRWQGMLATALTSLLVLGDVARAAGARAPVFIAGESGTGKELAAHAVHCAGERCDRPFVALNCAALPESLAESELFGVERGAYTGATRSRPGAFMRAQGGTLFLDEVGELSPFVQAKLLRALEAGEVHPVGAERAVKCDVRIVAASWKDLENEGESGRFRHDLWHRLCVLRVDLIPLRLRRADILPLVRELLRTNDVAELMPDLELARLLEAAPWRGNVRELKNGVLRAAAAHDPAALLPPEIAKRRALRRGRHEEAQHDLLAATLMHHRGNRKRSASALGISRSTLYRWMEAQGALRSTPQGGAVRGRAATSASSPGDGLTPLARRL